MGEGMGKRNRPTYRLVNTPHKKTLSLYEGLSKPYTSILIQMRSQRIGLRHFLFKIATAQQRAEGPQTGVTVMRAAKLPCMSSSSARYTPGSGPRC